MDHTHTATFTTTNLRSMAFSEIQAVIKTQCSKSSHISLISYDQRRRLPPSRWVRTRPFEACSIHPISGPNQVLATYPGGTACRDPSTGLWGRGGGENGTKPNFGIWGETDAPGCDRSSSGLKQATASVALFVLH